MADDTILNPGSGGDTIATDDIGGVKHQKVKVEFGASDSATQVDGSNPLPVEIGDGTNQATVDTDGALRVDQPNLVSTNNSSVATLGISGNFTGTADDVSGYAAVTVLIDASHDSATDGMTFEFSSDNSNWDDSYSFTYTAPGARRFQFPVTGQYFRVNYTNGGVGQTHFRLQTILHRSNVLTSIHRLVDNTHPDRSAQVMKAAVIAQAAGAGDFVPVQATAGGALKHDLSEIDGNAPDLGAGNAGAGTQRVVVATDQAAIDVDGSAVTQPVSAATLPLPTGAATAANQLPDGHAVTVDNAGAGAAVNVQDGGNSLTVDAPVGTPVNVQIGDGVEQANVTAANRLEVDGSAVTHPISAASLPLPTGAATAAGQLADGHNVAVNAALPAGDNNIGNVDVVTLPALPAGTNNIGDVDVLTQPARDRTTDNVGVAIQTDVLANDTTMLTPKFANIDTATSGNNAIVAAVGGATIRVLSVIVTASGAVDVYFNDGTANLLGGTRLVKLDNTGAAGAVGFSLPFNPVGWFETAAVNRPINLNLGAAVGVAGCLVYVEV